MANRMKNMFVYRNGWYIGGTETWRSLGNGPFNSAYHRPVFVGVNEIARLKVYQHVLSLFGLSLSQFADCQDVTRTCGKETAILLTLNCVLHIAAKHYELTMGVAILVSRRVLVKAPGGKINARCERQSASSVFERNLASQSAIHDRVCHRKLCRQRSRQRLSIPSFLRGLALLRQHQTDILNSR